MVRLVIPLRPIVFRINHDGGPVATVFHFGGILEFGMVLLAPSCEPVSVPRYEYPPVPLFLSFASSLPCPGYP